MEELVALGAVDPGHGVLGRARPVSGRDMYKLWDLRVIEQVEEEWEVKVEEALEVVEVEEVGCRTSDTQGSMAALAEAEAWSSLDWMLITG